MGSGASVREATQDDLEAIRRLHHALCLNEREMGFDSDLDPDASFSEHFTAYLKARITENTGLALVALQDEEVAGYLLGDVDDGKDALTAHLESMFVVPANRRGGIGRMLAGRFLEWVKAKGATRTTVAVAPGNQEAIGLYRALGFKDRTLILEMRSPQGEGLHNA